MREQTSRAAFFEAKYRETADPWDFSSSSYELERYTTMLVALSHRRYAKAFEPGCSVGVLTEQLAAICDEVLALDFSATAVHRAQRRCALLKGVAIHCAAFPEQLPSRDCDLIVLSEIGYYFTPEDWADVVTRLGTSMAPGATLLATHWLGVSSDHRMGGDQVHEILGANCLLRHEYAERHDAFRLDRWVRL